MDERNSIKTKRLLALMEEWDRNPQFKRACAQYWDPGVYEHYCQVIEQLKSVDRITKIKEVNKFLDISEIKVEDDDNDKNK